MTQKGLLLRVKLIKANFVKDHDLFDKMDPFCIIKIGNINQTSNVKYSSGKHAIWNQFYRFKIQNQQLYKIFLLFYDQDIDSNQFIGIAQFQIKNINKKGEQQFHKLDILKGRQKVGTVQLSFKYLIDVEKLGTLKLTLLSANLLKNTRFFLKMDPYVKIHYGERKVQTNIDKKGGKLPNWNQTFQFQIENLYQQLKFQVYDKNKYKQDQVGKGFCIYDPICYFQRYYSVNLFYNDNFSGKINVIILIQQS